MHNDCIKKKCGTYNTIDFTKNSYRDWDYIYSPYKYTTKINGKSKKREINTSLDNQAKLHPNTKRTIIPDFSPHHTFRRSKKEVNNINLISGESKLFQTKKKFDIHKSNINNEKNSLNNNSKGKLCAKFRSLKFSQILYLPGPYKRCEININDDVEKTKNKIKRMNKDINYMKKIKNDFFSKVTCLPNTLNNNTFKKIKRGKTYNNFKTNDNVRKCYTRYKNQESKISFDMLKPSSYFNLKYNLRKNII